MAKSMLKFVRARNAGGINVLYEHGMLSSDKDFTPELVADIYKGMMRAGDDLCYVCVAIRDNVKIEGHIVAALPPDVGYGLVMELSASSDSIRSSLVKRVLNWLDTTGRTRLRFESNRVDATPEVMKEFGFEWVFSTFELDTSPEEEEETEESSILDAMGEGTGEIEDEEEQDTPSIDLGDDVRLARPTEEVEDV